MEAFRCQLNALKTHPKTGEGVPPPLGPLSTAVWASVCPGNLAAGLMACNARKRQDSFTALRKHVKSVKTRAAGMGWVSPAISLQTEGSLWERGRIPSGKRLDEKGGLGTADHVKHWS